MLKKILILSLIVSLGLYGENLDLSAYKLNLGGSLSAPMKITRHDEFKLGLKIAPSFGVFVAPNLEQKIQFSLSSNYIFSKQESLVKTPIFWDLSWASIYYFKTPWRLRPYLGGGLGVGFMDINLYSINILIDMPVGILIELTTNLALDIGIPVRVRVSPRAFFDTVELPVGVIGLFYLFN